MTLWIIYLTSTHPKLSKNVYVYCIIPSSLFTKISFKRANELSASFCGISNELRENSSCQSPGQPQPTRSSEINYILHTKLEEWLLCLATMSQNAHNNGTCSTAPPLSKGGKLHNLTQNVGPPPKSPVHVVACWKVIREVGFQVLFSILYPPTQFSRNVGLM